MIMGESILKHRITLRNGLWEISHGAIVQVLKGKLVKIPALVIGPRGNPSELSDVRYCPGKSYLFL